MSEFWEPKIKVCKVDIKVLLQKCWVGPPIACWSVAEREYWTHRWRHLTIGVGWTVSRIVGSGFCVGVHSGSWGG